METSFTELRNKEVINVLSGRLLGHVCDIIFDLRCNKNIIINQIIENILLNHKVYWFKEVKEFEEYYDIISFEDSDYIFIIIG